MNYTKGEWKVTDSAFSRFHTYRGKRQGGRTFITTALNLDQIAEAQGNTQEEAEANANLIAAAPLMYEALKSLVNDWVITNGERVGELTMRAIYQALAKAEGGVIQ